MWLADDFLDPEVEEVDEVHRVKDHGRIGTPTGSANANHILIGSSQSSISSHDGDLANDLHSLSKQAQGIGN